MATLRDESKLYRTLDDMYQNNKSDDISEMFLTNALRLRLNLANEKFNLRCLS